MPRMPTPDCTECGHPLDTIGEVEWETVHPQCFCMVTWHPRREYDYSRGMWSECSECDGRGRARWQLKLSDQCPGCEVDGVMTAHKRAADENGDPLIEDLTARFWPGDPAPSGYAYDGRSPAWGSYSWRSPSWGDSFAGWVRDMIAPDRYEERPMPSYQGPFVPSYQQWPVPPRRRPSMYSPYRPSMPPNQRNFGPSDYGSPMPPYQRPYPRPYQERHQGPYHMQSPYDRWLSQILSNRSCDRY